MLAVSGTSDFDLGLEAKSYNKGIFFLKIKRGFLLKRVEENIIFFLLLNFAFDLCLFEQEYL